MKQRLDFLDGVRALAALYVVMVHTSATVWWPPPRHPHFLAVPWGYGIYAVMVFMVLSGVCLMLPVVRNGGAMPVPAAEYLGRRARRILPPYYAALALSLVVILSGLGQGYSTPWDDSAHLTLAGVVSHLMLLQHLAGTSPQWCYPLWTTGVEFWLYPWLPALAWAFLRFGATITTLAVGAAAILTSRAVAHQGMTISFVPLLVCCFALGAWAAWAAFSPEAKRLRCRVRWGRVAALLVAASLSSLAYWAGGQNYYEGQFAYGVFALGITCLLVRCCVREESGGSRLTRLLSAPALVTLGGFSYSLYLVHAPILAVLAGRLVFPWWSLLGADWSFLILSIVVVPMVVSCSYLFFLACEKPFLRRRLSPTGSTPSDRPLAPEIVGHVR